MPKMSLAPQLNQYRMFFVQNLPTNSKHAPETYRARKGLYANNQLPTESAVELITLLYVAYAYILIFSLT